MSSNPPHIFDLDRWEQASKPVVSMAKDYPAGYSVQWHQHPRGQLIYASSGVMHLRTRDSYWLLPPMRGVWMPPGAEHAMSAATDVSLRSLYVNIDAFAADFTDRPTGIAVSPLLRELLLRAASFSLEYADGSFEARLLALALDEMRASSEHGLHLPTGQDRRLVKLCESLIHDPGDASTLAGWAERVGATSRTLSRLFLSEIGMSFTMWRQQLRIVGAVPRLIAGERIADVAASLGYGTQSAFTVMFKRVTGKLPSDYQAR
ncbi:helix-turn-helix transcriptional regulator [Paraburkholderia sp. Ac-20340]|uniref:AraC family transcriptional regulator n=1 Tax=Paraburkholderia sp. Ac-20340 TaxID=2703888 RepID=UPI001982013A|nr:helix-turn-helix transcriptional regulator [Paraburkholderia sp. Ac-20340]